MIRYAILTVSDKGARGEREDRSGPAIREMLPDPPYRLHSYQILPDEREEIARALKELADENQVDLVLTTGGTGLAPRDVTPEATAEVIEREVPGLVEAMRMEGLRVTPLAMLSRAVAGIRKETLIVNLPGSPKGVRENLAVILPVLPHAIEKLLGDPGECGKEEGIPSSGVRLESCTSE
ncbi:MAG: MogA/MoaB family molybdenum cofactor biosynthesis protein [Candidatus Tectomicrobia bacterium]|uniref:Molybdenum cofactor biosynthesis protein B n=1 Tax=Tectimicrobiota bacterium TaxID=2528274 RepID=A0A932CMQ7_UNCTE|nr:MogA/MoaB family molybdenum cofactor biosynthesis protein [Candidatus Tectomicrobia bacterium]